MAQSKWTGELDLTVFNNGIVPLHEISFEHSESPSSCVS